MIDDFLVGITAVCIIIIIALLSVIAFEEFEFLALLIMPGLWLCYVFGQFINKRWN